MVRRSRAQDLELARVAKPRRVLDVDTRELVSSDMVIQQGECGVFASR